MNRKDGLKVFSFRLDPEMARKFEDFCDKHSGDPKSWLLEFALDWLTSLKDSDFRRLYEPFYQWRSIRKREIKLEMVKQKEKDKT